MGIAEWKDGQTLDEMLDTAALILGGVGGQNSPVPKKEVHTMREDDSAPTSAKEFVTLWDGAA
jgi:hypothetical protein